MIEGRLAQKHIWHRWFLHIYGFFDRPWKCCQSHKNRVMFKFYYALRSKIAVFSHLTLYPPLQNHVFHLPILPIFQKWLYEMSRSVKGLGYWLIFSSKSKFFQLNFSSFTYWFLKVVKTPEKRWGLKG